MGISESIAYAFSSEGISDASWKLADAIRLGDFFDDHNIPPQILLVIAIALIIAVVWMLIPAPEYYCGDGTCDPGEAYYNCIEDCPREKAARPAKIKINTELPSGTYTAKITSSHGEVIWQSDLMPGDEAQLPGFYDPFAELSITDPSGNTSSVGLTSVIEDAALNSTTVLPEPNGTIWTQENDSDDNDSDDNETEIDPTIIIITYPGDFVIIPDTGDIFDTSFEECMGYYLTSEPTLESAYIEYLMDILDAINLTGVPPIGADVRCVDLNGDGYMTYDDRLCFSGSLDETFRRLSTCVDCFPFPTGFEVCNDGIDNDCDGQTDRDDYDNENEQFYTLNGVRTDVCTCSEITPCGILRSETGIAGVINEDNVSRCAMISGLGPNYKWYPENKWRCQENMLGWTLRCGENTFNCTTDSTNGFFWNNTEDCTRYPGGELMCTACTINSVCDGIESAETCPEDCGLMVLSGLDIRSPHVIYDLETYSYVMWFSGEYDSRSGIFRAESDDGVYWNDITRVLSTGSSGSYDYEYVGEPTIIQMEESSGDKYLLMYYTAIPDTDGQVENMAIIALANSTDGKNWEKVKMIAIPSQTMSAQDETVLSVEETTLLANPSALILDDEIYLYFDAVRGDSSTFVAIAKTNTSSPEEFEIVSELEFDDAPLFNGSTYCPLCSLPNPSVFDDGSGLSMVYSASAQTRNGIYIMHSGNAVGWSAPSLLLAEPLNHYGAITPAGLSGPFGERLFFFAMPESKLAFKGNLIYRLIRE